MSNAIKIGMVVQLPDERRFTITGQSATDPDAWHLNGEASTAHVAYLIKHHGWKIVDHDAASRDRARREIDAVFREMAATFAERAAVMAAEEGVDGCSPQDAKRLIRALRRWEVDLLTEHEIAAYQRAIKPAPLLGRPARKWWAR